MSAGGKKLTDLRVCDLKDELERRSLETGGNKIALVERLQKALKDEGKDPDTYIFEPPGKRIPNKKTSVKIKTEEPEEKTADDSVDGDVVIVDEVGMVDEDEVHNVDADNNDNEESLNLTIEEEEQNLLHQQAQDGKDDSKTESGGIDSSNCNNDIITIKKEKEDEPEAEESVAENADVDATKNGDANADGDTEESAEGEHKKDDSDQSSAAKTPAGKDEKDKAAAGAASLKKSTASSSRNLWVSGLSSLTRASDLKTIFSKYGKVIGAKVVTNTRTPGTRCYGYVTMASSADASRCIEHLHHAELHGRIISVERTKSEIGSSGAVAAKKDDNAKPANENSESNAESGKDGAKEVKKTGDKANSVDRKKSEARSRKSSRARSDRKTIRSNSRGRQRSPPRRVRRSVERERERKRDVLSFQKIREERERQRMRERERELREEERRRRDFRRRQREEEERLAREREKLRMERERLEREKAELLRLERERQKLEREKIELERLELKRQQMKILQRNEESKRSIKRPAPEDRYASSSGHSESKRSNTDRRFEAPPPPRFDSSITRSADKKRDDYTSSKRDDYKRDLDSSSSRHTSSNYHSSRDTHKESRYSVPDPPRSSFRRDDRESRNSGSKRFEGPSYGERSSGGGSSSSNWHNSGPPAIKSFAVSQMSNNVPSWQGKSSETSNNHWPSQDRYDRTYNERSGPYMDPSSRQSGMFVGSGSGRPQDRYGGQMSRYENGKY